jgi:hypothetical protein
MKKVSEGVRKVIAATKHFLIWPSGANLDVLQRCPEEWSFYVAVGSVVWVIAGLAGAGMGLMMLHAGATLLTARCIGTAWSFAVVLMERFLLISCQKIGTTQQNPWGKLLPVARMVMAVCLAFVIGEHIDQFLFQQEITAQLQQDCLDSRGANQSKAIAAAPQINDLRREKADQQRRIEAKDAEIIGLQKAYVAEAEGTGGSGARGKGPLYEDKKKDYELAVAERAKLQDRLDVVNTDFRGLTERSNQIADSANQAKCGERGFLASHHALMRIVARDLTSGMLYALITIFLILFDLLPIFSKLARGETAHDRILNQDREFRLHTEHLQHEARVDTSTKDAETAKQLAEHLRAVHAQMARDAIAAASTDATSPLAAYRTYLIELVAAQVKAKLTQTFSAPTSSVRPDGYIERPAVRVVPAKEIGIAPFVLIFQHPERELTGRDLHATLFALLNNGQIPAEARPRFERSRVTNKAGMEIETASPLMEQLGDDMSVYLTPLLAAL